MGKSEKQRLRRKAITKAAADARLERVIHSPHRKKLPLTSRQIAPDAIEGLPPFLPQNQGYRIAQQPMQCNALLHDGFQCNQVIPVGAQYFWAEVIDPAKTNKYEGFTTLIFCAVCAPEESYED